MADTDSSSIYIYIYSNNRRVVVRVIFWREWRFGNLENLMEIMSPLRGERGERGRSALLETRAARHRRQFPLFPPRLFHDAIAPRASFSPPIPPARHAPCPRTGKSANARRPWTFTSSTRRRRRSSSSPRAPGRSSATSRTVRARSIREVWAGV